MRIHYHCRIGGKASPNSPHTAISRHQGESHLFEHIRGVAEFGKANFHSFHKRKEESAHLAFGFSTVVEGELRPGLLSVTYVIASLLVARVKVPEAS
jgi:hypothetical protein